MTGDTVSARFRSTSKRWVGPRPRAAIDPLTPRESFLRALIAVRRGTVSAGNPSIDRSSANPSTPPSRLVSDGGRSSSNYEPMKASARSTFTPRGSTESRVIRAIAPLGPVHSE